MTSKLESCFSDVYKNYLIYARKKLKNQSYDSLVYNFNKRILPFFKDMYLKDIDSETILKWEDYILKFNFSNNYNRNLYYLLSGFFDYCKIFYDFDKTIISNIGCFKKKYEKNKSDYYTLEEFKHFIKYFDDNVYKQFFNFMFYVGTRPGEAMALRFSDLKNGYISVNKTIESHKNRDVGTPKNFSSNRVIAIDKFLEEDLLELKSYYKEKYKLDMDFYIFGGAKPLSPSTINRRKLKACEKAKIRPITLHQFRHSHATLLMSENVLINEVSRRLGHSKPSTTMDIYTHTNLEQEKRVINTLNSLRHKFFSYDSLVYNFKKFMSNILKH